MNANSIGHQDLLDDLDGHLEFVQDLAGGVHMACKALTSAHERDSMTALTAALNGEIVSVGATVARAREVKVEGRPESRAMSLTPPPADMDWDDSWDLYDALRTMEDVCSGLQCQPRFLVQGTGGYSPAGSYLNDLGCALGLAAGSIARRAADAKPTDEVGKHRVVLAEEVRAFEGVQEIASLAARLAGRQS